MVKRPPPGSSESKNWLLLINSSQLSSSICLVDPTTRQCLAIPEKKTHAQLVLKTIVDLMTKADLRLANVAGIGVVNDTGSFTGTKVGIAVANALAWAGGRPVVGLKIGQWTDRYDRLSRFIGRSRSWPVRPNLPPPNLTTGRSLR